MIIFLVLPIYAWFLPSNQGCGSRFSQTIGSRSSYSLNIQIITSSKIEIMFHIFFDPRFDQIMIIIMIKIYWFESGFLAGRIHIRSFFISTRIHNPTLNDPPQCHGNWRKLSPWLHTTLLVMSFRSSGLLFRVYYIVHIPGYFRTWSAGKWRMDY